MGDVDELLSAVFSPPYPSDPYPLYDELRAAGPLHQADGGLWVATTYDAALDVFRLPELGQGSGSESRLRRDRRYADSPALQTLSFMLPFLDPPDHTRLRRLISRAFTPRAVEQLRGFVTALADRLVDGLLTNGSGDVVADFADHIPVAVICEMLGAPPDRHADLVRWADSLVHAIHPHVDDEHLALADEGAGCFRAYVDELIASRRADPRDDLLTALVQAEEDGDTLDAQELVSTVVVFIGAGIENTKHLIGFAIERFLRDHELCDLLGTGEVPWPAAVEEVLRLEPPVQVSLPRLVLDEVEIAGTRLPVGARVSALVASANRDPAVFDRPGEFDPQRNGPPNLSLASGAHFCTGAGLARLEAAVAVERFVTRLAGSELGEPVVRTDIRPSLRGYGALDITVGNEASIG